MMDQFIKEVTAPRYARRGRTGRVFWLPLAMALVLGACTPVPPVPGEGAERTESSTLAGVNALPASTGTGVLEEKSASAVTSSVQSDSPGVVVSATESHRTLIKQRSIPIVPVPAAASRPPPTLKPVLGKTPAERPSIPEKQPKRVKAEKPKTPQTVAEPVTLTAKTVGTTASQAAERPSREVPAKVKSAGGHEPLLAIQRMSPQHLPDQPAIPSSQTAGPSTTAAKAGTSQKRRRLPVARVERLPVGDTLLEMVKLTGGTFLMGSNAGDVDERPVHEVSIRPFRIGRFEVTQRQWQGVMGTNPSYFAECADCPVDSVSWEDIQLFLAKLNQQPGKPFRLPSEAEWEYACRAGEDTAYCGDSDETQNAWFAANSGGRSQPVGKLAPNGFGLYDMSGNAYEWVADCWHSGYGDAPADGAAWSAGDCQRRVLRGGAWYYAPAYGGATYRNANTPYSRFVIYGFRLAQDE